MVNSLVEASKTLNLISNPILIKENLKSLIRLCSSIKQISQLHAKIHFLGLQRDSLLVTELVRFIAISSLPAKNLIYARTLVDRYSDDLSPIPWNFLVRGYVSAESPREAITAYREMRRRRIRPNVFTFPFVLKACTDIKALGEGQQVRVDVFKFGVYDDVYVGNTLVHFYGVCKRIKEASQVFDEMPERNLVSYNSIMTACVDNSCFREAIDYFRNTRESGREFEPDETTTVLLLMVSAELGSLGFGRQVHSRMTVKGITLNAKLGTALVDMYAKSGDLGNARTLFGGLRERNVWTWSAMILGLAQHGFAREALEVFSRMTERPNEVTLLGVLCACSHAGLVNEARRCFRDIRDVYGIEPVMEHYGAMVDALCRSGRASEAREFVSRMGIEPDAVVWRTLFGASGDDDCDAVEREKVRERLMEAEPQKSENLVISANTYAAAGMWEEAAKVRATMKSARLRKPAAHSCIEVGVSVRTFLSGYDDTRPDSDTVYQLIHLLNLHMRTVCVY